MVVTNELLFVDCNTKSYIILEFHWGASNIFEFVDSVKKPMYVRRRKRGRETERNKMPAPNISVLGDLGGDPHAALRSLNPCD